MTTILVVGATGLVGSEVIRQGLVDSRIAKIVAVTRIPLSPSLKLENHVINFDHIPKDAPWWTVDAGICAMGTTRAVTKSQDDYYKIDVEYPHTIAQILKQHGTEAFCHTTCVGASPKSWFSYLKMKGEIEERLKSIGFRSLTIVRPSVLLGQREKPRVGEAAMFSLMKVAKIFLPKRFRAVSAAQVAQALLNAAINAQPGIHVRESETL